MRILWISTWNSDLHTGGGGTYARGIRELLREAYPQAEVEVVEPDAPLSRSRHRLRQALSILRSIVSSQSAKWHFDRHAALVPKLEAAIARGKPDLAFLIGTSAGEYRDLVPVGVPRVSVILDIGSGLHGQRLDRALLPLRLLLRDFLDDSRKHLAHERRVLASADGCIAISADEIGRIASIAGKALPSLVVPPVFPHDVPAVRERGVAGAIRLGFVGKLSWWPNREAIEWFLREVWPQVERDEIELHLYGEGSEALHARAAGVHGHGYQDDLEGVWRAIDVFVNPMRSGTGVSVKICEALYRGLPVLTSREGLRGLGLPDDPAVGICERREDWHRRLQPERLRAHAREAPPESVRAHFDASAHVARLKSFIAGLSSSPECRQAASSV